MGDCIINASYICLHLYVGTSVSPGQSSCHSISTPFSDSTEHINSCVELTHHPSDDPTAICVCNCIKRFTDIWYASSHCTKLQAIVQSCDQNILGFEWAPFHLQIICKPSLWPCADASVLAHNRSHYSVASIHIFLHIACSRLHIRHAVWYGVAEPSSIQLCSGLRIPFVHNLAYHQDAHAR